MHGELARLELPAAGEGHPLSMQLLSSVPTRELVVRLGEGTALTQPTRAAQRTASHPPELLHQDPWAGVQFFHFLGWRVTEADGREAV